MESRFEANHPGDGLCVVVCVDIRLESYRHFSPPFSDAFFIPSINSTIRYYFVTQSSFLDQHDGMATDCFATADVADLLARLGFHVDRIDWQPDERRNPLSNLRF